MPTPPIWDPDALIPYNTTKTWINYIGGNNFIGYKKVIPQADYCQKVQMWLKANPIEFGKDGLPLKDYRYIYNDYAVFTNTKEIIKDVATLAKKIQLPDGKLGLDYRTNMFYFKLVNRHNFFQIDKNILCEGQLYNHIPGNEHIATKEGLVRSITEYFQMFGQDCIVPWSFMPETYDLSIEDQCISAI